MHLKHPDVFLKNMGMLYIKTSGCFIQQHADVIEREVLYKDEQEAMVQPGTSIYCCTTKSYEIAWV